MNNQFNINYDFPGLCALCHVEIAEFNGSGANGRPIIKALKGNFTEMKIGLSDNSKMTVSLCNNCHDNFKPEDMKPLMESVINGWQSELEVVDWVEEKKLDYMDKYSKLKATDHGDFSYSDKQKKRIKSPDKKNLNIKVRK